MTTLERLREAEQQQAAAARAEYARLVVGAADGTDPDDAAAALKVIASAGRSTEDFAADVQRLRDRRAAADVLAQQDRRDRARAEAATAVVELEGKRAALLADLDGQLRVARSDLGAARDRAAECSRAKSRLLDTAPAELRERHARLGRQRDAVERRLRDLQRQCDVAAEAAAREVAEPSWVEAHALGGILSAEEVMQRHREANAARTAQALLPVLRDQTAAAEAELVRLDAEIVATVNEMLQP